MAKSSITYSLHQVLKTRSAAEMCGANGYLTVSELAEITGFARGSIQRVLRKDDRFIPRWNENYTRRIGWCLSDSMQHHAWTNPLVSERAYKAVGK